MGAQALLDWPMLGSATHPMLSPQCTRITEHTMVVTLVALLQDLGEVIWDKGQGLGQAASSHGEHQGERQNQGQGLWAQHQTDLHWLPMLLCPWVTLGVFSVPGNQAR